jgi:peptidoglycan/xylan/chitin deacetylase (PgdA/CDA1 family)
MNQNPELRPRIPLISLQKNNRENKKFKIIFSVFVILLLGVGFGLWYHRRASHLIVKTQNVVTTESTPTVSVRSGETNVLTGLSPSLNGSTNILGSTNLQSISQTIAAVTTNNGASSGVLNHATEKIEENSNAVQVVHFGPSDQKRIALTFDDGPHSVITPKVLEVLRSNEVKATFFVLGNQVKKNPKILAQEVAEGHEIGNHTYSHRLLTSMTTNLIQSEFFDTQHLIKNAVGFEPELFRPPYGVYRASTKTLLLENHMNTIVLWSIDPEDWKSRDSEKVFNIITNKVQNGSIILCHDIYPTTLNMLPNLIHELKSRGFELVTISQLCGLTTNGNGQTKTISVPHVSQTPATAVTVTVTNVVTITNSVVVPEIK